MIFKCEYKDGTFFTLVDIVHIAISEYSFILKSNNATHYLRKENMKSFEIIQGENMLEYSISLYGTFVYNGKIKARNEDEMWDKIYAELDNTNFDIDDIHNDEIEQL